MDGILIIDKPEGLTSHDVVSRVRRILRTKRVGHTGTLDPFATGVLVLLIGKATRLAQFLDKDEKEYEAVIQFGFQTDTGDGTGSRIGDFGIRMEDVAERLSIVDWDKVLAKFRGELMQTPPMYSAKKIEGKKLYELARQGVEIERKPIPVVVHELELLPAGFGSASWVVGIRVVCSAGTYIRTLAEDIGREVGTGAHLTDLRRTRAGKFSIDQALTLEGLAEEVDPASKLISMEDAVRHLPEMKLNGERVARARDGLATRVESSIAADGGAVRMLDPNLELIAIGIYNEEEKSVKPKIVLR